MRSLGILGLNKLDFPDKTTPWFSTKVVLFEITRGYGKDRVRVMFGRMLRVEERDGELG